MHEQSATVRQVDVARAGIGDVDFEAAWRAQRWGAFSRYDVFVPVLLEACPSVARRVHDQQTSL